MKIEESLENFDKSELHFKLKISRNSNLSLVCNCELEKRIFVKNFNSWRLLSKICYWATQYADAGPEKP